MEYMLGCDPACLPRSLVLLILAAGCSNAQAPLPGETLAFERKLVVEHFATERLWVWQKRLNLQGWDISVAVSPADVLRPGTVGNIHWDNEKKTAVIRILDPASYHMPFAAMLRDIEFTVVHELIHLGMAPVLSNLQRTDANRLEEEHAVNHMADALLKLDRGQ